MPSVLLYIVDVVTCVIINVLTGRAMQFSSFHSKIVYDENLL